MVPKSTNFDEWLRRKPTTKITLLINFRQFYPILSTIFPEHDVTDIRVIPQKNFSLIDASMGIPTIPINTLDGEDTNAQREC